MAQHIRLKNPLPHIRRLALGGTASIVGSAVASNLLRIVSSMTLTRLLSAEAFGVVGIILSVSYVVTLISDIGVYSFVLRHKENGDPTFLDQIWTLRLIRAAGLTVVMMLIAWPAAMFMQKPGLAPVLAVWSISFLIEGAASMAHMTAVRDSRLWRLTILELAVSVFQLLLSICLALWLRSYWALVIAMIGGSTSRGLLSYTMFPGGRRRIRFDRARAAELWSFSRFIAMSSFLTMLIMQSDKLILARIMPLATYGLYAIAVTLASAPLALAHTYTTRILYPAYALAARAEPPQLAAIYYPKRRLVALAYMTAAGGMIGSAELLVALLYDPRYHAVTPFLQLLAISTALALINFAADEALVASGRPRWTLYANIGRAVWLIAGGVAAVLIHRIILLVAVFGLLELFATGCYWWGLQRIGVLRLRQEALGFAAIGVGAAMGFAVARTVLWMVPTL